jgi:hypothetical protein
MPDGMDQNVELHGRIRRATGEETAAVRSLPGCSDGVVFAYPGHGVGLRHHELSGCTSQMLLLSTAYGTLARQGVRVFGLSTEPPEKHAHLAEGLVVHCPPDTAARLPHVDLDGERYLTRWTMFLGGPHDGLLVEEITDSVAHTRAVMDLLTDIFAGRTNSTT